MGGNPENISFGEHNTYVDNHPGGDELLYGGWSQFAQNLPDNVYSEVDPTISTAHGAFAGETPYVLSGVPSGPVIIDLELPNAVEKSEELKVTVKIGTQK